MKPYDQMNAVERYNMWIMYQNACALCTTYEGRHDYHLQRKRNNKADELYQGWIQYFTAEDIKEPKEVDQ